ncbi:MAG TPA: hypothetical protein VEV62_17365, partial [Parafilimonas sp.]|nr:hypothetical protein [Parafilimonas sp.]
EKNNNCSESNCEKLIDLFESIYINERYIFEEKENRFYLLNSCGFKIAEPVLSNINLEEWKQQLLKVACYFPITRKAVATNERLCNFYIRIKLPAFDSCEDDLIQTDTGCENVADCKPGCYIAWKSDCCFNSCCEALLFYMRSLLIIRDYNNYKKVYECDCGCYGIESHLDYFINRKVEARSAEINNMPGIINFLCNDEKDAAGAYDNSRYERINRCANEIVAVNPQQYTNEIVACDAVERAKKLINSEGLHVVEHILLRPQCKNTDGIYDDCNCNALPKPCIDYDNICNFKWEPGEDPGPCEDKTNPLCFTPGCDPYSFIATVALPAWSQRFRSKENRAVIEKLLQKEAPAHVLLRILWLNPRDFCCFEYEFKNWNYWLAKKLCANYNNCNFLEFLFKKKFAAFADCEECLPCSCDVEELVSCFETEKDNCDDFNSRINDLFCWNRDDSNYNFSICEPCNCREEDTQTNNDGEVILKKAKKKTALEVLKNIEHRAQIEANEKNKTVALPSREKAKQIQARAYAYNENVKKIIESNPGNKVAENALRFLSDVNPGPKRYDDLINQVLNNKSDKSKKVKALSLKNKQALIQNITWQYLDRICFSDNEMQKIKQHKSLFNHLRKNKIDMHAVYEEWKANEVKKIEPAVDINEIKRLLT